MILQTERVCAHLFLYRVAGIIAKIVLMSKHGILVSVNRLQRKRWRKFWIPGNHDWINGLSLLGGEPFEPENQRVLLPFLVMFKERFPDKTIWCYTGFTLEEIMGKRANSRAFTQISSEMLSLIDVLVDGPFVEAKKDISLIFRGSSNQRIIDVKKTFENKQVELYLDDGK